MKTLSVILLSLVMSLTMGFAWAGLGGAGGQGGDSPRKAGCNVETSPDCG